MFGAELHHYDSLMKGQVRLADLLSEWNRTSLIDLIGQLLSNSSALAHRCSSDQLVLLYGVILIQSIFVYAQQLCPSSSFFLHWTRNFPELVLRSKRDDLKELLPRFFPTDSPWVRSLCDQLLEQLSSSRTSFRLVNCQFEYPPGPSQFSSEWFLSKHSSAVLNDVDLLDEQIKVKSLDERFGIFSEKLNRLWHEKTSSSPEDERFQISFIHDQIHLLKERLPPRLKIPSNLDFQQDFINVALYQVGMSL